MKLLFVFIISFIILSIYSCDSAEEFGDCIKLGVTISQEGSDKLVTSLTETTGGPFSYAWSNGLGNFTEISVSESATYSVTVTDLSTNCTAKTSFEFTAPSGNGCGSFTAVFDKENNFYEIVTIGTQCWMKSNVVIEAGIPNITNATAWGQATTPAWSHYENDAATGLKYGKLYNWYAVKSGLLCPDGWRIPAMSDWEKLISFLQKDSLASIAMRKMDPLWQGTVHATNESEFCALPGGRRQAGGSFAFAGTQAGFWAVDESTISGSAKSILIQSTWDGIHRSDWGKNHGFSCRCIKN